MSSLDTDYPCVGVCMIDAETGYCLGCGRPPAATPGNEALPAVAPRLEDPAADGAADAEAAAEPVAEAH